MKVHFVTTQNHDQPITLRQDEEGEIKATFGGGCCGGSCHARRPENVLDMFSNIMKNQPKPEETCDE